MQTTVGFSPKTILAGVLPAAGTVLAVLITWAVTNELDRQELVIALTGLSAAFVSAVGAWAASPGNVQTIDPASETHDLHENPDLGV